MLEEAAQFSLLTAISDKADDDEEDARTQITCAISSFDLQHFANTSILDNGIRTIYSRVSDIVEADDHFKDVQRMLELCGNTCGVDTKFRNNSISYIPYHVRRERHTYRDR